ncbi:hypothetical protein OCH239_17350 [Roseivivax halodurans JCM 10272]|uniref:PRC-barrel domain-containing protein n=1 Tax=Roseivivax halodurans JCM 10272 TaxID=1449350 RepID=X7EC19_9RHOB|nr:hypothetical protein [Roseivivax halodurans]ETX12756.1 hypothetical protein OCH239_17350 [Roseivivax halodurans JCM 10272]
MKLKALMMSAATAALLAGAATAQDDSDSQAENSAETAAEEAGDAAQAAGEAAEQAGEEAAQETQDAAQDAEQAAEDAADSAETAAEDASSEASQEMDEAESEMEGEGSGEQEQPTSLAEMTVGDVTGMNVFGPEDDRIGEIDYVIDRGDGPEAIIGIGGFLGLGEYTVALPMDNFQLQQDPEGFGIDTDRETLEQQPEIDESEVEALPDDTMMSDLMSDTGAEGATGGSAMDSGSTSGDAASGGDMSSGSSDSGSSMDSSGSGGSDMEETGSDTEENSGN